ncbi:MAG: dTMP kinase [Candidatus Thorarchaeota archaeon]
MTQKSQGFLIAIEGIDGTGKTSIVKSLIESLTKDGYQVTSFKEPTNETDAGKQIRRSYTEKRAPIEVELQWFIEDRRWNVENNILPSLEKGYIVLLDRYFFSTACYQGARRGANWKKILEINRANFPEPDLTVIIDLEPKISIQRIVKDRNSSNTFEGLQYLKKVRKIFLKIATKDKIGNYLLVNGAKPLQEVITEIYSKVHELIQKKD